MITSNITNFSHRHIIVFSFGCLLLYRDFFRFIPHISMKILRQAMKFEISFFHCRKKKSKVAMKAFRSCRLIIEF